MGGFSIGLRLVQTCFCLPQNTTDVSCVEKQGVFLSFGMKLSSNLVMLYIKTTYNYCQLWSKSSSIMYSS